MADRDEPTSHRIHGKLVRAGEDQDAFDREFWRAMTGEQRVEALWGMVLDMLAINGELGDDEPRLQRTVGRILRR